MTERIFVPPLAGTSPSDILAWSRLVSVALNSRISDAADAANAAQSTADTATANASTAQSTADTAVSLANTAQSSADSAQSTADQALPSVGDVQVFGNTLPSGWLECDGSSVSRSDYPALYDAIGTTYGTGSGVATFNIPNIRAIVIDNSGESVTSLDNITKITIKFGIKT